MPVSSRVYTDATIVESAEYVGPRGHIENYVICVYKRGYRIYHDIGGYSSTTGQVSKRGRVVRDEDYNAYFFKTAKEAVSCVEQGFPCTGEE